LALRVIRVKGSDEGDSVLTKTIAFRDGLALSITAKPGKVGSVGKRNGVRLWS